MLRMMAGGIAMVASGTLLAACGSEDAEDDDAVGASGAGPAAVTNTITSSSGSIPDEFVFANEREPSDLLPGWGGGFGPATVLRALYQPLINPRISLDDNGFVISEMEMVLASAYEQVDETRWRFVLREDVRFHNGEAFNAQAVKVNFDYNTDEAVLAKYDRSDQLGVAIAACEIVDDMTVDFVLTKPDNEVPGFRLRGLLFVPPSLLEAQGFDSLFENPVGTGPYKFESWTRGQDLLLSKFEDYWKTDAFGANMPAVRFIVRPEASVRAQTVTAGEAHFAYNIGMELAQTLDQSIQGGGFQSSGIRLNNTIEPTSNYDLRKAMNLAIDRQGIIDSIFLGAATPLAFFGFQPVELDPYPYDPEEAAKLISDGGWDGTELELIYGENRIPEEPQLAEIYKASFEAVGLKIKLSRLDANQYNDISGADFNLQPPVVMETTSSGNSGEIAGGLRDKYGCDGTGTFCDLAFDAEYDELAALTGDERTAKLQSIAERLHLEETSRIWVAGVQQVHGIAANVETNFPTNTYAFMDDIRFT